MRNEVIGLFDSFMALLAFWGGVDLFGEDDE